MHKRNHFNFPKYSSLCNILDTYKIKIYFSVNNKLAQITEEYDVLSLGYQTRGKGNNLKYA